MDPICKILTIDLILLWSNDTKHNNNLTITGLLPSYERRTSTVITNREEIPPWKKFHRVGSPISPASHSKIFSNWTNCWSPSEQLGQDLSTKTHLSNIRVKYISSSLCTWPASVILSPARLSEDGEIFCNRTTGPWDWQPEDLSTCAHVPACEAHMHNIATKYYSTLNIGHRGVYVILGHILSPA